MEFSNNPSVFKKFRQSESKFPRDEELEKWKESTKCKYALHIQTLVAMKSLDKLRVTPYVSLETPVKSVLRELAKLRLQMEEKLPNMIKFVDQNPSYLRLEFNWQAKKVVYNHDIENGVLTRNLTISKDLAPFIAFVGQWIDNGFQVKKTKEDQEIDEIKAFQEQALAEFHGLSARNEQLPEYKIRKSNQMIERNFDITTLGRQVEIEGETYLDKHFSQLSVSDQYTPGDDYVHQEVKAIRQEEAKANAAKKKLQDTLEKQRKLRAKQQEENEDDDEPKFMVKHCDEALNTRKDMRKVFDEQQVSTTKKRVHRELTEAQKEQRREAYKRRKLEKESKTPEKQLELEGEDKEEEKE